MRRWWSLACVFALAAAPLVAPGVATACACGGLISPDPSLRVADEMALVAGDGTTETVVMRLNLDTSADNAALVVPTPAPATVTGADPDVFDELAALSAPRVEKLRRWTWGWANAEAPSGEGVMIGAVPGAPTVLSQVQLGPLEATTLSGGDLAGVREWLSGNGYDLRPEISAGLDPYLRAGWSVVAMRLTTDGEPLDGPLAPVTLRFASDELMYPMRMSAEASTPQTVVVYTLGEHKTRRIDRDAADQYVNLDYAGPLAGRTGDTTLLGLSDSGDYLTKTTTSIVDPEHITSDFLFGPAPDDDPFQAVVYDYEYRNLTLPALGAVAAVIVAGATWTVILISRRVRRRTRAR
ncbi:DUF2330 domain-containing protein [Mycobacterium sp. Y57]|uniref:DUF2330 domain-containing protein n=1 Tax=Mycolicibacterium xanthum TaxID=2796469 RepID=UPI001C849554|nr:DUF2330 domain-containing protein [Mycolicibacterium xanthum]MBX7435003.1 DUF2330 domain-containing protein [Mycolicibacterium xanthum]